MERLKIRLIQYLAEKQSSKSGLFGGISKAFKFGVNTVSNPVDFVGKTVSDVANFGVNTVSDVANFNVNTVSDVAKFGYSNTVGSIVNKKSSKEKKELDININKIQINKTINSVKWIPVGN